MRLRRKIVITAILILVIAAVVYAQLTPRVTIHNYGTIKGIGVGIYSDSECTEETTFIDWGILDSRGDWSNTTLFMKNEKNTNFTLSYQTGNWTPPEAESYLSLTWNYTDQVVHPEQVIPVDLRLQVYANVTGFTNFSFEITVTPSEFL